MMSLDRSSLIRSTSSSALLNLCVLSASMAFTLLLRTSISSRSPRAWMLSILVDTQISPTLRKAKGP